MKPAFLSAGRYSASTCNSARVTPCRMATACALTPPPKTFTSVRYCPEVEVTSNGWRMIMRDDSRPKYWSAGRSFTTNSPSPDLIRTRATDVLRFPVPQNTLLSALIGVSPTLDQWNGLLRPMGVVRPRIDLELRGQPAAEPVLREHPLDRLPEQPRGALVEHLLCAGPPDAARVPRVANVRLVTQLPSREPDALRVHHDDEIACVDVRRERRRVLPAQHRRDPCRQPPQHLPVGVGDVPAPPRPGGFGGETARGVRDRHAGLWKMTGPTRLELATSGVTGRRSNQLNYDPVLLGQERR